MKINTLITLAQELGFVFVNEYSFVSEVLKLDPFSYTIEDVYFGYDTISVHYFDNQTTRTSICSIKTADYLAWRYKEVTT
jgi:hypothetical protein